MKVYGVVYASMFDENNVFQHEKDAQKLIKRLKKLYKLPREDQMFRVVPIEVQERYDPTKYRAKKIMAQPTLADPIGLPATQALPSTPIITCPKDNKTQCNGYTTTPPSCPDCPATTKFDSIPVNDATKEKVKKE